MPQAQLNACRDEIITGLLPASLSVPRVWATAVEINPEVDESPLSLALGCLSVLIRKKRGICFFFHA